MNKQYQDLLEAAKAVVDARTDKLKPMNIHLMGIESVVENCWIIPHDKLFALKRAIDECEKVSRS